MGRVRKIDNTESYMLPFPKRLRELLDRPGETQAKLASAIKVNRQSIGQWKDGVTAPDIYALEKIADYFRTSTDYLLGKTDLQSSDVEDIALYNKIGLSDLAILRLYMFNKFGFSIELSELISSQKILDALTTIKEMNSQKEKYLIELKSIADLINSKNDLTSQDVKNMIDNNRNRYKGEISSENYRALYITEYIEFLRLKLIDVMSSLVNEITGIVEDENEFIISTLIKFLDKNNPTYTEKFNAIESFNTPSWTDISKTIESYKEMLNDYIQSAEWDMNEER